MRPVPVVFLLFPFSDQLTSSQCQFSTWLKKKRISEIWTRDMAHREGFG